MEDHTKRPPARNAAVRCGMVGDDMTYRENAAVLETYLHNIRNIEEAPPGPAELEALDAAVEAMKAAVENVEYGAFAWDKQRGVFVPIGRSVLAKQLCLNRYQERVRNGDIPSWIDPEKFKILERTVAEIAGDWKEAKDE